jgi:type IV fimbrial biogenesis protein FimT
LLDYQERWIVLISNSRQRGISLIEVMITVAIVVILLAVAIPGMSSWAQNAQIRTMADSIQAGLQLARSEAVRRNTTMRFQLMDTADNACAPSLSGGVWVVSQRDASGACATAPEEDASAVASTNPVIKQIRRASEGSRNAVVAATAATVIFNALGQPTTGANTIDVTNPTGGTCVAATGQMRCLRIVLTVGGQIRLCDPARTSTVANPDPQAC